MMNIIFIGKVWIVLLLLNLFSACNNDQADKGTYDEARKKAGLPLVPKDWKYFKDESSMSYWYRPSNGPTPPYTYYQKWLQADGDKLIKEENLFKGARYALENSDSTDEQLMVGAYYGADKSVIRWDITYKGPGHDLLRLTKPQADSILKNWGVKTI
jgi:hypothetical protein